MSKLRKFAPYGILFLVVLLLEAIFFRGMIFSRDYIQGDLSDSRFISLVMEHWFKVFTGENRIRDLAIFYPVKSTLGYSDTMFLMALPFSLLRAIGLSWLDAYQITIIIIHLFGGLCLVYFLRRKLRLPVWACVLGLIIGGYSNAYYIILGHLQFLTTSFLPLLFILMYGFFENLAPEKRKKRLVYGISSIVLFSAILLTAAYIGYFTALFMLIAAIAIAVYKYKAGVFKIKQLISIIWANKIEVFIYIAVTALSLIPFIWIYVPVFVGMGSGGYEWIEVTQHMPRWYDLFNVSDGNRLWQFPTGSISLSYGFPVVTAVILAIACTYFIRKKSRNQDINQRDPEHTMAVGFSFAIAIGLLLIIQFDLSGLNVMGILSRITKLFGLPETMVVHSSLWWPIYFLLPGASALRGVVRFMFYMMLPAGILISYFTALKFKAAGKGNIKYALIAAALLAVIFIEHQNTLNMTHWTKSGMNRYLESVSPPPEHLESFILINNVDFDENIGFNTDNLDAWSIASNFGINTINGQSGQFPISRTWLSLFADITKTGNFYALRDWININNLSNVYMYDYKNDLWILVTEQLLIDMETPFILDNLTEYSPGETVTLIGPKSVYQFTGWSLSEPLYTWTDGRAGLSENASVLAMKVKSTQDLTLQLNINRVFNTNPADIYINDTLVDSIVFEEGANTVNIPKELIEDDGVLVIRLAFSGLVSPQMLGESSDDRLLGIAVESFVISP